MGYGFQATRGLPSSHLGGESEVVIEIGINSHHHSLGRRRMRTRFILQSLAAAAAVMLLPVSPQSARAQGQAPAAIAGQVSSEAEGAMEGVVVSAKKKE